MISEMNGVGVSKHCSMYCYRRESEDINTIGSYRSGTRVLGVMNDMRDEWSLVRYTNPFFVTDGTRRMSTPPVHIVQEPR